MYCNKPADQLIQIIRKQIVHLRHHKKIGCNPLEQHSNYSTVTSSFMLVMLPSDNAKG